MKFTNCKPWLLAGMASLAIGIGAGQAQTPPPIFTSHAVLRLPVQLDERSRAEVTEIKLYVRGPSGKWECVQTTPPTQTSFDYRAPADGEYSFTFVTVDRRGRATPPSVEAVAPHRVVVVDTTPPTVTAELKTLKTGTFLQCHVQETNPDWASLRAKFLAPGNTWQALEPVGTDSPGLFKAPSTIVIENKVRVEIADRAGNRTVQDIDLGSPQAPPKVPARTAVEKGRPDPATLTKDIDPAVSPSPAIPDVRNAAFPELPKAPNVDTLAVPPLPDVPPTKGFDPTPQMKLPAEPDVKIPLPPAPELKMPAPPTPPADPAPSRVPDVRPPADNHKVPEIPDIVSPDAKPPIDLPPPPVMPASRNAASAMKPSDLPPMPSPKAEPLTTEKSTGSHPVLNTRTCTINYKLEGGARLANRIDFWATGDGGRTWNRLDDASHGASPAKLTLPGDGVYGIRIRPGGGSRPPEPGEEPDCVVEVDTTSPVVNLLPPTFSSEEGTMLLTWTAADTNLLGNSINLYYSLKQEGPWNVIVSGYKNEGVYRWTLPAGLTGPIYLRLEAMDRAGNVGRVELPTPFAIDVGKQRVKVLGVGPAE